MSALPLTREFGCVPAINTRLSLLLLASLCAKYSRDQGLLLLLSSLDFVIRVCSIVEAYCRRYASRPTCRGSRGITLDFYREWIPIALLVRSLRTIIPDLCS